MHAIASAIASSLRTSMPPLGSRPLPPLGILPLRLGAQLSRGTRCGGARSSCGVASSAGGCPALSLSYTGRSAGAMAATPPGGQSSCGSMRWSTRSQLQGRQSGRGPTRWRPKMQRALFKHLQVLRSSDGLDFHWVAGPAAGLRGGPPGNGARRVASPTAGIRGGGPFASSHLPLSSYAPARDATFIKLV